MQWLVSHCPCALELCCQTLIQYVEDGVSREFSSRFFHDRRERRLGGLASQEPSAIIELFNSVLSFLASVVSSEQLCDLSWPVAEFAEAGGSRLLPHLHWNAPEHLAWLRQAILGFQLPQMDLPPAGGTCLCRGDWLEGVWGLHSPDPFCCRDTSRCRAPLCPWPPMASTRTCLWVQMSGRFGVFWSGSCWPSTTS